MKANIFITDSDFSNTDKTFEYLLGFQASFGGIVLTKNKIIIFLDSRYILNKEKINIDNIKNKTGVDKVIYIEFENGYVGLLDKIIEITKESKTIYLENNIASKYYDYLKNNSSSKINLNENFFGEQRIIKQENEIENIKKAIEIIDKVFLYIENLNKKGKLIGKIENEIRSIIINKIFEYGGSGESFDSIVAFGKNSAIPHHHTGSTIIGNGPLLLDIGAVYNGYCSDFTRTIWVGEKNEEYKDFKKIYNIVKQAHDKAYKNYESGFSGSDIDKIARDHIKENGYGEYFTHSLGHGVGLDIHENPRISIFSPDKIKNGMVFTIEPGIYLENKFGIRLEDIVFVENGKLKKHTKVKL